MQWQSLIQYWCLAAFLGIFLGIIRAARIALKLIMASIVVLMTISNARRFYINELGIDISSMPNVVKEV